MSRTDPVLVSKLYEGLADTLKDPQAAPHLAPRPRSTPPPLPPSALRARTFSGVRNTRPTLPTLPMLPPLPGIPPLPPLSARAPGLLPRRPSARGLELVRLEPDLKELCRVPPRGPLGLAPAPAPRELMEVPVGLVIIDAAGRVLAFNDAESRHNPLVRERLVGRSFFTLAPWAMEVERRLREMAQNPARVRVHTFRFLLPQPGGGRCEVSITLSPGRVRGQYFLSILSSAHAPAP